MQAILLGIVIFLAPDLGQVSAPVLGQERAPLPKKDESKPIAKRLHLTVGSTQPLQMSKKQAIKTVINDNPEVVRISPTPADPTTVLITALAPGRARVTLVSEDGKKETLRFGKPAVNVTVAKR
jgi:hypothetical protein